MKFDDALVALRNGKKVRPVGWGRESWILVNDLGCIINNKGTYVNSWSSANLLTDEWEIVKELQKKEIWITLYGYENGTINIEQTFSKESSQEEDSRNKSYGMKVLARKKITLIEGEFDE